MISTKHTVYGLLSLVHFGPGCQVNTHSLLLYVVGVFLQVTTLYLVQVSSLLSVWFLQFCNSMILGSLVLSFIVAALFIRHCQVSVTNDGYEEEKSEIREGKDLEKTER